jgi:hypothetical protein
MDCRIADVSQVSALAKDAAIVLPRLAFATTRMERRLSPSKLQRLPPKDRVRRHFPESEGCWNGIKCTQRVPCIAMLDRHTEWALAF